MKYVLPVLLWLAPVFAIAQEPKPVPVGAVAFSPDGSQLIVGYGSRNVPGGLLLWNVEQQRAEKRVDGIPGVSSIAMASNGLLLAYTPLGRAPVGLKWPSLERAFELDAARRGPVALSPDSTLLAAAAMDGTVHLTELSSGKELLPLVGLERAMSISISPDSKLVAAAGEEGAIVWEISTGKEKFRFRHGNSLVSSILFTPDGRWLLTGGWDGAIKLWNVETGVLRAKFDGRGGVDRLAYSPATQLLIASSDPVIHVYGLDLTAPTDELKSRIKMELKRLDDDAYAVRQAASQELINIGFAAEADLANAVEQSPSAEVRIAARHIRQTILQTPLARFSAHRADVNGLALSPDGKTLASASTDGTVRIWDLERNKQLSEFVPAAVKVMEP